MEVNIIENNKLIAEFMGYEFIEQKANCIITKDNFLNPEVLASNAYKFNSSWDWLMPVVEKIENLEWRGEHIFICIDTYGCWIEHKNKIICKVGTKAYEDLTKIEATHRAVLQFIKWHNKNA